MDKKIQQSRIVPAICTQCSAQITVDTAQDAAICSHCGTAFVVKKAIKRYDIGEITGTHIHHIDTVNIHAKTESERPTPLNFINRYIDRRAQVQIEREKRKAENERINAERNKQALKYLPIILVFFLVMLWLIRDG